MAEWFKATVLKTVERVQRSLSSNLSCDAIWPRGLGVMTLPCHGRNREFKSRRGRQQRHIQQNFK